MPNDKILRMEQLVRELNEASDAYYNGRAEQMTDYEWDQRFDELKALENETGTTRPRRKFPRIPLRVRRRNTSLQPSRWQRPNRLATS